LTLCGFLLLELIVGTRHVRFSEKKRRKAFEAVDPEVKYLYTEKKDWQHEKLADFRFFVKTNIDVVR